MARCNAVECTAVERDAFYNSAMVCTQRMCWIRINSILFVIPRSVLSTRIFSICFLLIVSIALFTACLWLIHAEYSSLFTEQVGCTSGRLQTGQVPPTHRPPRKIFCAENIFFLQILHLKNECFPLPFYLCVGCVITNLKICLPRLFWNKQSDGHCTLNSLIRHRLCFCLPLFAILAFAFININHKFRTFDINWHRNHHFCFFPLFNVLVARVSASCLETDIPTPLKGNTSAHSPTRVCWFLGCLIFFSSGTAKYSSQYTMKLHSFVDEHSRKNWPKPHNFGPSNTTRRKKHCQLHWRCVKEKSFFCFEFRRVACRIYWSCWIMAYATACPICTLTSFWRIGVFSCISRQSFCCFPFLTPFQLGCHSVTKLLVSCCCALTCQKRKSVAQLGQHQVNAVFIFFLARCKIRTVGFEMPSMEHKTTWPSNHTRKAVLE